VTAHRHKGHEPHGPKVRRVYEAASDADGLRVLVDRLWPRGLTKEKARIDLWLKDIAPSDALRRRLHADPAQWDAFLADYHRELEAEPARSAVAELRERAARGPVTLLFSARNEDRNNATALRDWLTKAH
jgi:uncharacterized protein YeaO (DUF488 family)